MTLRGADHGPHVCVDHRPAKPATAANELGVSAPKALDRSVWQVRNVFEGVAAAAALGGTEDLEHWVGPPHCGKDWAHVPLARVTSWLIRRQRLDYKSAACSSDPCHRSLDHEAR